MQSNTETLTSTTNPSPLRRMLLANQSSGLPSMGIFLTCGFPTIADTVPVLNAIASAGADFVELGMPFSDPLAEGGPIQYSSEVALSNGVSIPVVLETAAAFCQGSSVPLLLMGYYNPILQYGISNFCRDAGSAGVAGLIIPDLPPDEGASFFEAAAESGLDIVLLVAPNTSDQRIRMIDAHATGFVYAVSVTGLTGSDIDSAASVNAYLKRARRLAERNPLLVGFGIRNAEDAAALGAHTDGFIVGSALISRVRALWASGIDAQARIAGVVEFVGALRPARKP